MGVNVTLQGTAGATANLNQVQFSAEAQAVFNRMPNALDEDWKTKSATFIDALESNGLLSKHDQLLMLGNNDEANSLTDWQGTVDAVNVNSTPHTPYSGAGHSGFAGYAPDGGTKYINKRFNPSVHGSNYVQNSAFEWAFLMTNNDIGNTSRLFGALEANSPFEGNQIVQRSEPNNDIITGINSSDNKATGIIIYNSVDFNNQTMYLLYRDASDNQEFWEGGTNVASNTTSSAALRNMEHYLGGGNFGGLDGAFNCEVVMAGIGGGVINPATLNTLIRDYLTDLGII